ncbi:MAG: hypothetical protein HZB51_19940 [Chloroflexi bacterium]|nr:hypothetical protein [Chloroflexota bacterium]
MDNADTMGILRQLERGEINAREADARLYAPRVERTDTPPFDPVDLPQWMRMMWGIPLTLGILIVLLGTCIIASTVHANILWFLIGLPVVLFGTLLIVIGAGAFSGHWLYVNVEPTRRNKRPIRFGIPFPIGLLHLVAWVAPWAISFSKNRIRTRHGDWDWDDPSEIIAALERELRDGRGITIDVDDKNGRVQVYIV